MTTDEVVAFLRFWDRLPDATLKGDARLAQVIDRQRVRE